MNDESDNHMEEVIANNLKITIVPHITTGAGLNGANFDYTLSPELKSWFDSYQDTWNTFKRSPSLIQPCLKAVLLEQHDPLNVALKLFANCPGSIYLRTKTLPLFILDTVCELFKQKPSIADNCDNNTRMVAFNFVKTCGLSVLYRAVMDTFQLHKIRDILVSKIKDLIELGYYKDAAYWTMNLKATNCFSMFDIAFPLVLQDRLSLVEDYLVAATEQRKEFVVFLDSLLEKHKTAIEKCEQIIIEYKYIEAKLDILHYRPLSKLISRLAKRFSLNDEETPNLKFGKACGFMHYMYRKYKDGEMSCKSWREIARDAAKSHDLQMDLIMHIAYQNNQQEAAYWALFFKMPPENFPTEVQNAIKTIDMKTYGIIEEDAVDTATTSRGRNNCLARKNCLTLDLPSDAIILVDVKSTFMEMIAYLDVQKIIGFDSEWKPTAFNYNTVSLLQMATLERVYLVDCESTLIDEQCWKLLGKNIFNNIEILKIGFSLNSDLRTLDRSLPLQIDLQIAACYVDLLDLFRRLKIMQIQNYPYGHANNVGESLSALAQLCLGKKLDKSDQCSNWSNRPLREEQITYAALDAHCLIQIYRVFDETLQIDGLDINRIVDEMIDAKSKFSLSFSKRRGCFQQKQNADYSTNFRNYNRDKLSARNCASKIQLVCDRTLGELARELRKFGINCIEMHPRNFRDCLQRLNNDEDCFLVTKRNRRRRFDTKVLDRKIFCIENEPVNDQAISVLYYFQIDLTYKNLYTRCLECNSDEFILAFREDVKAMRFGVLSLVHENKSERCINFVEKTFNLKNINEHIIKTRTTYQGMPIKLNQINSPILRVKEHFYICDNCGTCNWDNKDMIESSSINTIFPIVCIN